MDLTTEWILQKKGSVNLKTEQHKVSKLKKGEKACWKSKGHSLCYLWNIIKCSNINVVGASEKEKRDWDFKNLRKIIGFSPQFDEKYQQWFKKFSEWTSYWKIKTKKTTSRKS